jgi:hypothetical protein
MNETDVNEIESLINSARDLIEKINETHRQNEETGDLEQIMAEVDTADDDECSEERIREHEQRLFPYLTKENLVALLKTYKRLVAITNVDNSEKKHEIDEISVNMDTQCTLRHSNDVQRLVRSNSETLLNEIRSMLVKNNAPPSLTTATSSGDGSSSGSREDDHDLSKHLIVTSLPEEVFTDSDLRYQFEQMFLELDAKCAFFYFKAFKRCRLQCHDFISALLVKCELDNFPFANTTIRVYITKV